MNNRFGIDIPEKCLTCHFCKKSKFEDEIRCNLHLKNFKKSDSCNDYLISSFYDNIGRNIGKVKDIGYVKFKKDYISSHPELTEKEIKEVYNKQKFLF